MYNCVESTWYFTTLYYCCQTNQQQPVVLFVKYVPNNYQLYALIFQLCDRFYFWRIWKFGSVFLWWKTFVHTFIQNIQRSKPFINVNLHKKSDIWALQFFSEFINICKRIIHEFTTLGTWYGRKFFDVSEIEYYDFYDLNLFKWILLKCGLISIDSTWFSC